MTAPVDAICRAHADWLLDAVATATQDRRFLRGDPAYDEVAGSAILLNGEAAIRAAISKVLAHVIDAGLKPKPKGGRDA